VSPASVVSSRSADRRLQIAIAANAAIVAAQVIVGAIAHSLGLIADAAHNLTDVAALSLSLWAVRASRREPTGRQSFGWHRGSVLAAQANAAALLVLTALLAAEALRRLPDPPAVHGGPVLAMAALAAVVNAASAAVLSHDLHAHDLAMRSALLHLVADAGVSAGVAVAGAVILLTGEHQWLDPAATLGIAALLAYAAWRMLRKTSAVLLEATPAGIDPAEVTAAIAAVTGVESVHDLHVWSLSGSVHALSVHVVLAGHPTLEEAQVVGTAVKAAVSAPYRIAHATVELECEGCVDDGAWCAISPAVLSRIEHHGHGH
jgi:cobalt-zinc-cadmium efflux system protein